MDLLELFKNLLGHTQSWGPGAPGLLTRCYKKDGTPEDFYGPINPANTKNYKFLKDFFTEIFHVFPDSYVHLGGDEVDFSCWYTFCNIYATIIVSMFQV